MYTFSPKQDYKQQGLQRQPHTVAGNRRLPSSQLPGKRTSSTTFAPLETGKALIPKAVERGLGQGSNTPREKCCPHSQDKSMGYYSLKEMSVKLLSSSVGSRPHPATVWLQIRNRQTEMRARRWLPGLWPPRRDYFYHHLPLNRSRLSTKLNFCFIAYSCFFCLNSLPFP